MDAQIPQPARRPGHDIAPPLLRERLGLALRLERTAQRRTLAEVAQRAGISTQYLSEIERGVKDPSSEVLDAAAGALGLDLPDLLRLVLGSLQRDDRRALTSLSRSAADPEPLQRGNQQVSLSLVA
ncbi:helix-turn-helix domain-containing protein [Sediminivirga luteola]|uniref:helix-turn-helix domain-containing protein n=1 Tax=Sediminivirga luteola TaxID=1774748 RepID=UPI001F57FC21|nr:helix-turn-helix transcriptional regulator [Sediminivirga luteola]MCI2266779.1 helix-turn-helix domain-containing protein [Sediminivirga luteola]